MQYGTGVRIYPPSCRCQDGSAQRQREGGVLQAGLWSVRVKQVTPTKEKKALAGKARKLPCATRWLSVCLWDLSATRPLLTLDIAWQRDLVGVGAAGAGAGCSVGAAGGRAQQGRTIATRRRGRRREHANNKERQQAGTPGGWHAFGVSDPGPKQTVGRRKPCRMQIGWQAIGAAPERDTEGCAGLGRSNP